MFLDFGYLSGTAMVDFGILVSEFWVDFGLMVSVYDFLCLLIPEFTNFRCYGRPDSQVLCICGVGCNLLLVVFCGC